MVVVITAPNCIPCRFTKKRLADRGVPFEERNIAEDPEALELAKSLGHSQSPVVIAPDGTHFGGFDPDRIDALSRNTH